MRTNLPLTNGRRPGSSGGGPGRTGQRSPGAGVEVAQRRRTATDDVAAVSSSSDGFSDDTASSANDRTVTGAPSPGQ